MNILDNSEEFSMIDFHVVYQYRETNLSQIQKKQA